MLVLSRKKNEKITINGEGIPKDIVITVVQIQGDKIRLGIEAPREISIMRNEVIERIQEKERCERDQQQVQPVVRPENFLETSL